MISASLEFANDLPGADLVASGIAALHRGEVTVEALLVLVGAPRLRDGGIDVPPSPPLGHTPELSLYLALSKIHGADAHSRYNSLIRRLVSFERALDAVRSRPSGGWPGR